MRNLLAALLLLLLFSAAIPAAAAPTAQNTAVTLTARPAFGGVYRTGSWFPIAVTLENEGADRAGEVRVGVPRAAVFYATRVDLPRGARKTVTVYARTESPTRRLDVSFVVGGETLAGTQIRLDPHTTGDLLVGVLAPAATGLRVSDQRSRDNTRLFLVELNVTDLPEQTLGLQSFTSITIDDTATESLSLAQREALQGWVAQGGRLILGGTGARATLTGLPDELRPVDLGEPGLSGEGDELGRLANAAAPTEPLESVQATPREGSVVVAGKSQPLLVERRVGRGQVLFLALSFNSAALAAWPGAPALWDQLLRPQQLVMPTGAWAPGVSDLDEFRMQSVAGTLTNLPSLDLPSLWLLGSLLLAYILLVGPLAYFVLRQLDRQALGWVILPAITVLFSVAAYSVGYQLRGGDIVLNQINIIEPLLSDQVRVRSFVGIFSPDTRSYSISVAGQPLMRPVSLFGPWGGGPQSAQEDGVFVQQDVGVTGFSVGQWSMRGFMAESTQPLGLVESKLVYSNGRFEGEVFNNTQMTLRDAILVRGTEIARLGDIPPGQRRSGRLEIQGGVDPGMSLGYLIYKDQLVMEGNQPPDREVQRRQNLIDALFNAGPFMRGSEPLLLGWLDITPHEATLSGGRVDARHLTLLSAEPRLVLQDTSLDLERGWAQLQAFDTNNQPSSCYTPQGQGFGTYNGDVEATLRLPDVLRGVRIDALSLLLGSDGAWPPKATIELYDLRNAEWTPLQVIAPGSTPIVEPERFLSSGGTLRLRFSAGGAPTSNCVTADLSLKGMRP